MRLFEAVGIGRIVVVWSHGFRYPPIGHCRLGIALGGVPERPRGLFVVKGKDVAQALVKELLRLRIAGRDRMMQVSQAGDQGYGLSLVVPMVLRRRAQCTKDQRHYYGCCTLHSTPR